MFSKKAELTFFLSSLLALIFAYTLQFVFGIIPCNLCLYERVPYFIVMILSLFSLFKKYKIIIYMMFFFYFVSAIISFYHVGLESHWFFDVLGCTKKFDTLSFDAIKDLLLKENYIATCDRPYVIFGLSLTKWNLIYSILCITISLLLTHNIYERKRQ